MKVKLLSAVVSILLASVCAQTCPAGTSGGCGENFVIFVGNPGVGKSTILNTMLQDTEVGAGVSFGAGWTKNFSVHKWKNSEGIAYNFIDTPGMADVKIREEAAKEIEKGLKQDGVYRILFVVSEKQGRVVTDDKATMKTVLEAIQDAIKENDKFGVLVNQISKKTWKQLDKSNAKWKENRDTFTDALFDGLKIKTSFVDFLPTDASMEDGKIEFWPDNSETHKQIHSILASIPPTKLQPEQVAEVKVDKFDDLLKKMQQQQADHDKKIAALTGRSCAAACQVHGLNSLFSGTSPFCEGSCTGCSKCIRYEEAKHFTDYGEGCWTGHKHCCCFEGSRPAAQTGGVIRQAGKLVGQAGGEVIGNLVEQVGDEIGHFAAKPLASVFGMFR